MRVEADGRTVLHEISPDINVEVEGIVHQEQPMRGLLPHDMVRIPIKVLSINSPMNSLMNSPTTRARTRTIGVYLDTHEPLAHTLTLRLNPVRFVACYRRFCRQQRSMIPQGEEESNMCIVDEDHDHRARAARLRGNVV